MDSYNLIDQLSEVQPALVKLRERGPEGSPSLLAVDCEGENLSRKGELSILALGLERNTFLFDIKKLGARVFDEGLREILQDPDREKLMFDCREDSDCLWHQYKVKLTNVMDLQLMQIIYAETHPVPGTRNRRQYSIPNFQPRLRGFTACLEIYVKDEKLLKAKRDGMLMMGRDGVAWVERPLKKGLLSYAAADVQGFFLLHRALKPSVSIPSDQVRLKYASKKYLEFLSSKDERSYDQFETNAYVPWRVLPERGGPSSDLERAHLENMACLVGRACLGCKRNFPRADFRFSIMVCPVCKKMQEEIDPFMILPLWKKEKRTK